ncbi:MAG: hypothetical protein MSH29_05305 [Tenericutes bacterium]|nr:hypothetical protein [Mycoplasmatota bacterium]
MDIESKKFLGQPKNFVSIFNALLFDGQPVLKPEYLMDENSELVMNVSSKHVDIIKRFKKPDTAWLFLLHTII